MNKNLPQFLELNIGLLFVATSGPLGRFITIESTLATFWRAIFGMLGMLILAKIVGANLKVDWGKHGMVFIGTSVLMVGHWVTYFYALDYSSVAVALTALYTFPAMTAVLEPIIKRTRIPLLDLVLALITFAAIYYISPPLDEGSKLGLAVGLGLASALCFGLRNIWISEISNIYSSITIMVYQLIFSSLLFTPFFFLESSTSDTSQWIALVALGLITTASGHTLFVRGIAHFQATTASIFMCLTPIYGICLALIFLNEVPNSRVVIGGIVILGVVIFKATKR